MRNEAFSGLTMQTSFISSSICIQFRLCQTILNLCKAQLEVLTIQAGGGGGGASPDGGGGGA